MGTELCKSDALGGCWPWLGDALGGWGPPLGDSMGCMRPHNSDDWVSPGYPPPMMLLDTDISPLVRGPERVTRES